MGFEINKIIVAVLVTILVVFGIGKISDLIFQTEKNVLAYKIEVSSENTTANKTETINIEVANTTYSAIFSSSNTFNAGDRISISVDSQDAPYLVTMTCIWKYDTTT